MDRQTDSLTFFATVRPETRAGTLDVSDLNVHFHIPRALMEGGNVKPQYQEIIEELKNLFLDRLALPHVRDYGLRVMNSGHGDWPTALSLPLTPTAAARTQRATPRTVPAHTPSHRMRTAPAREDDVFSSTPADRAPRSELFGPPAPADRASRAQPASPPLCGACSAHVDDDAHARLMDAHTIADQYKAVSLWTQSLTKPALPAVLACQAWQPGNAARIVEALNEAGDDGHAIYATLLSLNVCTLHTFEIAAAASHDHRHGLQIVGFCG